MVRYNIDPYQLSTQYLLIESSINNVNGSDIQKYKLILI